MKILNVTKKLEFHLMVLTNSFSRVKLSHYRTLNKQIKEQFELQDELVLKADFLLNYNIKPRDILDLIIKEDITKFIKDNGIKQERRRYFKHPWNITKMLRICI